MIETPLAANCFSQRPNHSAKTHPSKADWHLLSGITPLLQQRVDFAQELFSTERQPKIYVTVNYSSLMTSAIYIIYVYIC